jgi:uncharacterized protein involved in outer membrane biogenesis
MRAILMVLIVIVVAAIIAVATGLLNINQVRPARAPQVSATHNGVVAKGGQTPSFDVETGSVTVGTAQKTVKVPTVSVERPAANEAAPETVNGQ